MLIHTSCWMRTCCASMTQWAYYERIGRTERVQKVAVSILIDHNTRFTEYSFEMALVILNIDPLEVRKYYVKSLSSRHLNLDMLIYLKPIKISKNRIETLVFKQHAASRYVFIHFVLYVSFVQNNIRPLLSKVEGWVFLCWLFSQI